MKNRTRHVLIEHRPDRRLLGKKAEWVMSKREAVKFESIEEALDYVDAHFLQDVQLRVVFRDGGPDAVFRAQADQLRSPAQN